ncbi:MAG: hypothetical protein J4O05_09100, partial [Chloroflexi bacterium]|nr:hypothetical protein [Chloroflexota bacterium]
LVRSPPESSSDMKSIDHVSFRAVGGGRWPLAARSVFGPSSHDAIWSTIGTPSRRLNSLPS